MCYEIGSMCLVVRFFIDDSDDLGYIIVSVCLTNHLPFHAYASLCARLLSKLKQATAAAASVGNGSVIEAHSSSKETGQIPLPSQLSPSNSGGDDRIKHDKTSNPAVVNITDTVAMDVGTDGEVYNIDDNDDANDNDADADGDDDSDDDDYFEKLALSSAIDDDPLVLDNLDFGQGTRATPDAVSRGSSSRRPVRVMYDGSKPPSVRGVGAGRSSVTPVNVVSATMGQEYSCMGIPVYTTESPPTTTSPSSSSSSSSSSTLSNTTNTTKTVSSASSSLGSRLNQFITQQITKDDSSQEQTETDTSSEINMTLPPKVGLIVDMDACR